MSAHEATKTNQKLFHRYAKVFSEEDPGAFALHADKLAAWLSDHKAYYPAARPEIIRLMIIAQMTLRKVLAVGNDLSVPFKASDYSSHPMVPPYISLVKAIEPYQSHFVEPNLLNFFKSIVATASQDHSPDIAEARLPSTTSSTVSNMTPILPQAPVVTANNGADPPPQAQMTTEANLVTDPTSSSTMQDSAPVPDRPPPRIVKSKAKKRKTIDFELLVEQDIQGLLQRKGATPGTPETKTVQEQLQRPTVAQPEVRILEGNKMGSPLATSNSDVVSHVNPTEYKRGKSPNESHGAQPINRDFQQMDLDENPVNSPIKAQEPNYVPDELVQMKVETSHKPKGGQEIPTQSDSSIAQASPCENPSQMRVDKQKPEPLASSNESKELQSRTSMIQASRSDEHIVSLNPTELSKGIYGRELNIVAIQQGYTQHTKISLQFDIPEDQFDLISAWVKRKNDSQDVSLSICVTLCCYLVADLNEQAQRASLDTLKKQLSFAQVNWPCHGDLGMRTASGSFVEELPLSPPFLVTPHNTVDVSQLLLCGKNVIELIQHRGLSEYIFILLAHHPTQAQLKQLADRREKKQQWQNWVRTLAAPINLPLRPVIQS